MRAIAMRSLCRTFTQRTLARPPSIWGKLPAYGDFVHHNADLAARQAWHEWVQTVWHRRPEAAPRSRSTRAPATPWIEVSYTPQRADLSRVPVAFVLPPGHMSFAPGAYVQGIFIPSQDKVGRPCPLVIYQCVQHRWMERIWTSPWVQEAGPGARRAQEHGRHLLFWWSRVAAAAQQHQDPFDKLVERVDSVWQHHEPGWNELLGSDPAPVSQEALAHVVSRFAGPDSSDASPPLRGVYHLPWSDWPQRTLREHEPQPAFWMQDDDGGYVHASNSLLQLWGVRP